MEDLIDTYRPPSAGSEDEMSDEAEDFDLAMANAKNDLARVADLDLHVVGRLGCLLYLHASNATTEENSRTVEQITNAVSPLLDAVKTINAFLIASGVKELPGAVTQ